jgi:SH3-like domain-containing protein
MNAPIAILLSVVLASGSAWAQMSPPAGSLTLPSARGAAPAERPTAPPVPVPAPRAPVQQVAPMASPVLPQPPPRSALGSSAPGRPSAPAAKPPVVSPRPHSGAQKPPAVRPGVAAGAAAGVAAGAAAGAAAAKPPAVKPPEIKPPEAPPAESKPPEPSKGSVTGQPLPRWAGILYDGVKLRVGPGQRYPVEWIYRRPDQPVRVLREFETWRLIEDNEGVKGWVHQSNLTGRRSFMVPAERTLRRSAADDAGAVAVLRPGVVGRMRNCAANAVWCEVRVGDHRGWLKRDGLWGISPGEAVGN